MERSNARKCLHAQRRAQRMSEEEFARKLDLTFQEQNYARGYWSAQ
jgi:hypothetical protein